MPRNLPDIEDTFLKIENYNQNFAGTIDLSDMLVSIPLHVYSRVITTFTWNNIQCRFKGVPQGDKNSWITGHVTLIAGKAT